MFGRTVAFTLHVAAASCPPGSVERLGFPKALVPAANGQHVTESLVRQCVACLLMRFSHAQNTASALPFLPCDVGKKEEAHHRVRHVFTPHATSVPFDHVLDLRLYVKARATSDKESKSFQPAQLTVSGKRQLNACTSGHSSSRRAYKQIL